MTAKISNRVIILLFALLCAFLALCAFRLRSHPTTEFDEGVYLTTYRLVQNGFPLYQMTYHAQPPGFFLITYPLYLLGGSSLEAARLAIFAYALAGLLAILWLARELDSIGFAFVAIGVLYVIPIYTREILTFHADALPSTFSIIAIAAGLRFTAGSRRRWVLVSALALAMAVLIKADVSALPALLLILVQPIVTRRRSIRQSIGTATLFAAIVLSTIVLLTFPFGIGNVINDAFAFRAQAAVSVTGIAGFWDVLSQQNELHNVLIMSIVMASCVIILNRNRMWHVAILGVWLATTVAELLVYRPLWDHHFVLLAIPAGLLFSYGLYSLSKDIGAAPVLRISTALFLVAVCASRLVFASGTPERIPNAAQSAGIDIVRANTQPGDTIVSDDGIVTAFSGRLTPPMLSDLSLVRIKSGSLSPDDFARNLEVYKPKMVLVWSGRLTVLERFTQIMDQYHYILLPSADAGHLAYLLSP